MRNLNFKHLMTLVLTIVFAGCSNDEDSSNGCANGSWGDQTKVEADAVSAAAITFSTTPSKTTCESFRAAYIDYIDALEALVPCVPTQSRQAFDNALNEGKSELTNLNCNQDFQ